MFMKTLMNIIDPFHVWDSKNCSSYMTPLHKPLTIIGFSLVY
jgi:hypothetical protein